VSPGASDPNCTTNVTVTCAGATGWQCTFPAGYCSAGSAPNYCTGTQDICDNKDNNCNGAVDENFKPPVLNQGFVGQPCSTPASDGVCQGTGTFVCSGTSATACNAVRNNSLIAAEACDGKDNDCDGSIDEPFTAKGSNAVNWVKPAVTQIAASLWVYQYEASRPGATAGDPGSGNGYQTSAPPGTPLQKTQSCSVQGVVPWFNVTPQEAEQTCAARGGTLCSLAQWQTACRANASCTWGYAPRPTACALPGTYGTSNARICNIGPFDFDNNPGNGTQDGLRPTGSSLLSNCWADWSALFSPPNTATTNNIRDVTGNLRELTKDGSNYTLMGGAFNTQSEAGATCDFTFFTVTDPSFKLFDAGFRCCFTANPSAP
jgi:hypothetical protein